MAKKKKLKLKADPTVTDTAEMARSIFAKVRQIKADHPDISKRVNRHEDQIKELLIHIRTDINRLDPHERDLVSIMIINGLQKTAEEILAAD